MKMKPLTPDKIAEVTGGKYCGPVLRRAEHITGVTTDSRDVEKGSLFVCLKGEHADGHDYARAAAEEGGAACRLAERPLPDGHPYILVPSARRALCALAKYYRGLITVPVVGIIGSVGKTTAKELTACVLSRSFSVCKTQGNYNNELGVPLTLLSVGEEHEAVVVEMGISHFGEMRGLAEMVRPDVCVFTNVGYCHLESLGSLEGVLKAKSEVFEFMEPDAVAVMNGDDRLLRGYDPGIRKVTFGLGGDCDIRAENVAGLGLDGISCDICRGESRFFASIPAFGTHIVYGALAAAAAGHVLGVPDDEIRRGLAEYRPVGSRASIEQTGHITLIDDCYNANPNSMAASLRSLCSLRGRRVAILGDMKELGDDSAELHGKIGALAQELGVDLLLCVGPEAKYICDGYTAAGGRGGRHFAAKEELYPRLSSLIAENDTVLVKASHSMQFGDIVARLRAFGA